MLRSTLITAVRNARGLATRTIVESPFPPCPPGPYMRVPDMVMEHWDSYGSRLAVRCGITE